MPPLICISREVRSITSADTAILLSTEWPIQYSLRKVSGMKKIIVMKTSYVGARRSCFKNLCATTHRQDQPVSVLFDICSSRVAHRREATHEGSHTGGRPIGGRPTGGRPIGGRPIGERLIGGRLIGGRFIGGRPIGGRVIGTQ